MSRSLYQTGLAVERMRIQVNGRINATDREVAHLPKEHIELYESMDRQLREWEERIQKLVAGTLNEYPVWDYWLKHVKGVQSTMGSHLLYALLPPLPDKGPGTWFKAAGLFVVDREENRMPYKKKGEKVEYNIWLRRCLWVQADVFSKVGGYYKTVYQNHCFRLSHIHQGEKEWNDPHIHSVARWATIKLFLSHLYIMWLEAEGTEYTRKIYPERVLLHQYIPPPLWDGKNKI